MEEVDLRNVLNEMSRPVILPLKKITEIRMATVLCNSQKLIKIVKGCEAKKIFDMRYGKHFQDFKATANELLCTLEIGLYKEIILDWIWPIFYRMVNWRNMNGKYLAFRFPAHFYWTPDGRIDSGKTARDIVENGMDSIEIKFPLASFYCLTDEINKLWKEFQHGVSLDPYLERVNILSFWIKSLRDIDYFPEERMNELLINAIELKSIEAVKYLFSIMPEHMKNDKAMICFNYIKDRIDDIFHEDNCRIDFFIISQMTVENPYEFFRSSCETVLFLLLHSSRQEEFLKVWNYGFRFDFHFDFLGMLYLIILKLRCELYRDLNYRELFVRAWQSLPDYSKDTVKESSFGMEHFCCLIKVEFQFVLQIKRFTDIGSLIGSNLKKWSISNIRLSNKEDEWKLLHYLIEEEMVTVKKFEEEADLVKERFPKRTQINACKSFISFVSAKIKARKKM